MKDLWVEAVRIRMIEEEIAKRYPEQEMRCPVHLSIGQEVQAVGVCAALKPTDKMVSTHRSHAHYLAKGGNLKRMIAELYGKNTGCSGGHGGSMHLIDESVGFVGSTSIVGGTIPVGVGIAFANRLQGNNSLTAIMLGDAAVEEGVFHESLNFARLHDLDVLFVVENNAYSCYTKISERQGGGNLITGMAAAHDIPSKEVAWQDPYAIRGSVEELLRDYSGPKLIQLHTWRHREHCGPSFDDHLGYRPVEEINRWLARDVCESITLPTEDYAIQAEIKEAFEYARA